jgi:hypothetical protein
MVNTELFDQVVDAFAAGDEEELEHLARQGVPVQAVLFLSSMGGAVVYDDVGLLERLEQQESR